MASKNELAIAAVKDFGAEGYNAVLAALLPNFPGSPSVVAGKITIEDFAKGYILWAAKQVGHTFTDVPTKRAPKADKPEKAIGVKAKAPKLVAAVVGSLTDKPKVTDMTVEEIADKAAKRSKKKSKATGSGATPTTEGVENFDPAEARAYVDAVTDDIENFRAPSELSMEEVKALI